eukprot:Awhi_evm1s9917
MVHESKFMEGVSNCHLDKYEVLKHVVKSPYLPQVAISEPMEIHSALTICDHWDLCDGFF